MDKLVVWKSLIVFTFTYLVFWMTFYTFHPESFEDEDFVSPGSKVRGNVEEKTAMKSDKYLSDRGRTSIFYYSLVPAFLTTFSYIAFSFNLDKSSNVVCKKGAKTLGDCRLIK